jgi:hypothetical protein
VHVHIDSIGRHRDVEKERRPQSRHDRRSICGLHCPRDSSIANRASVDREKNAAGRRADIRGPLHESADVYDSRDVLHIEEILGVTTAPDAAETGANARDRRQRESVSPIVDDADTDAWLCYRERGDGIHRASPFGAGTAKKLESRGKVEEKIRHRHGSAAASSHTLGRRNLPTDHAN